MLKCHFFKKVTLWPPHLPDETEQPCDMWPLFTVLIWSDALQCPPPHRQLPEGKTVVAPVPGTQPVYLWDCRICKYNTTSVI